MVVDLLFVTRLLNGLIMIALPVGLAIFLTRRFRLGWRLFFIGAVSFILSQVGHIPFNYGVNLLFQRGILPLPPPAWKSLFDAVFLGLSAGLWEELTRYFIYRGWAKDARSWGRGLLLGAGHGGCEAILLGLLVLVTFVNMAILRGADLSALIPADQLELAREQVAQYWSIPWTLSLLGAVERLFTLPFHLACSILVLQTFLRRQGRWVWLAVGWHALADASLVYASGLWGGLPLGPYILEGVVGLFALASLAIVFLFRSPEPVEPAVAIAEGPVQPISLDGLPSKEETTLNLDETRYN
jgi:uncharacterized membrane protein YhfC